MSSGYSRRRRNYSRLLNHPYINRSRRANGASGLRRTDNSDDYLETIIIHSDSSEDERRLDSEIDRIRDRMDELDEEKSRLRREMATKFKERENVRVARYVKKNNLRLKREIEQRLLPNIERVASRRRDIVYGIRDLFDNIDDNDYGLPPTYESLFQTPTPELSTTTPTPAVATTSNTSSTAMADDNASTTSTSSTCSLPPASSLLESLINN